MNTNILKKIVLFGIINFLGLYIGALCTDPGTMSDWYQEMNKAPWTPPGWFFGFAWTVIMICFSVYLGILHEKLHEKRVFYFLFGAALFTNIAWNPLYFCCHCMEAALFDLVVLTLLIAYILWHYKKEMNYLSLLLIPYVVWGCIACSLNLYTILYN